MHWQRMEQSGGRNSIVGTTVREAESLPGHLVADEKHTRIGGEKAYVATTVAEGCVLGVSVTDSAGENALKDACAIYKDEARDVAPGYSPETVNTDGWKATMNAWKGLFPSVTLILCFLHTFISIRDRTKKKFGEIYDEVAEKLWDCCNAVTGASFPQRVRRFSEWAEKASLPSVIADKIGKMRGNIAAFAAAYAFPGAHRTSSMPDRLMRRMDGPRQLVTQVRTPKRREVCQCISESFNVGLKIILNSKKIKNSFKTDRKKTVKKIPEPLKIGHNGIIISQMFEESAQSRMILFFIQTVQNIVSHKACCGCETLLFHNIAPVQQCSDSEK